MKKNLVPSQIYWLMDKKIRMLILVFFFSIINQTFSNEKEVYSKKLTSKYSSKTEIPNTSTQINELINKELWNTLFPYRFGAKNTGSDGWVLDPADDFYTYESFIDAINRMSNIKVIFERRCGTNAYKVTRVDKVTNVSKLIRTDIDFDAPRNSEKEILIEEVDYGLFLKEGNLETRKREITAFFANISHETTGGWPTAPGGQFSWGLHFREEPTQASYAYPDVNYPPTPGKSYKGRGPIQLSYNYNYGPASEFIFGDKQVLLDNPEKIIEDAALAFQTAIWFWMTPQYPKPSAHSVMVNKWTPNELDITKNRVPGLGMTVNIINGGVECGQGAEKPQVLDRIGYYKRFTTIYQIGTDMDGVNDLSDCGCKDMSKYGGDSADLTAEPCAQKPQITFSSPVNDQIFKQTTFTAIPVTLVIDEKNTQLKSVTTSIGNQTFSGVTFNWTPSSYKAHTITSNAVFVNGTSATSSIKVIVWDGVNIDCQEITEWNSTKIYSKKDNYVKHNNIIYRNKWYAGSGSTPGIDSVWEFIKECDIIDVSAPVITWESPANGQIIEQDILSSIILKAKATDADGTIKSFNFKQGTTIISATLSVNSYEANYTPTAYGKVTIIASATDNDNNTTEKEITFTLKKVGVVDNKAPSVNITSPGNNASFNVGETIAITANASDSDGTIASVAFFNNGTKIGESTTTPYNYVITNSTIGNHTLTAIATDNQGAKTTSSPIAITVSEVVSGGCGTTQQYAAGTSYKLNEEVVNEGEKFKCNIPGWCSSTAAWAYAPSTGTYWEMAWESVGVCSNKLAQNSNYDDTADLTIKAKNASMVKIDLYNLSGRLIKSQTFSKNEVKNIKAFTEYLTNFERGLYFFKIHIDHNIYFKKIIKNN
ncbi:glycoside hydrolase family 19 protein [Tenacibaculum ovolyticum]|uniref:glycoside hydrolase family 19 protein n=1 Tax=Tenacibaculum ovolyticum TaxID=104270 RepID=UPI0009EDF907|nr:glycoside hydrolase family 19 protein [Tenacibaculum ovolyticum]